MLFLSAVSLGTPSDANPRVVIAGSGTPSVAMGPGGATAVDTFIRRSAAKTLIIDADGAGGGLTTVDFKTTNLWQNGSPITAVATQVQRASGAVSDYVAEIKLTADTQYRLFMGLDASGIPEILFGPGGTTAGDTRIYRNSAGQFTIDAGAAAVSTNLTINGAAGHQSLIGVALTADANYRTILEGDATLSGIVLGSGAATGDIFLYRNAAKSVKFDTDGAGGALTAFDVESAGFTWNGIPIARAVGQVVTVNFVVDGGGAAITTGIKGDLVIDFACTINQVTLLADQTGSVVVNIWKQTYASFPPTVTQKITASAPPTISAALKAQDATLTGWTTAISAGDVLRFNVDSAATVQRVTLSLKVTRT